MFQNILRLNPWGKPLLIVDDDPSFLETAERRWGSGRRVYLARDAEQAKELIGLVGQWLSMALIDLDLLAENGFSLISELRQAFPDFPVIAMSGSHKGAALESA